jgi:hypothetical protein
MSYTGFTHVDDTEIITNEIEEELEKQAKEDIKNIGDVNDILQPIPDLEKLSELKKMIDTMPREQIAELMASLSNNSKQIINPNENSYSSVSEREMLQIKMKQKKEQFRYARTSKKIKELEQAKQQQQQQEQHTQNDNNMDVETH